MSKAFSIIVPVYNVKKYIRQCIESIQNQTFKDFEAIFIDDCGNDDSIKTVEVFAKNDERIKIIHHDKNLGLSAARNTGLRAAIGEYILCVDSDDWIENDCLEKIYTAFKLHNTNSIIFNGYKYYENRKKKDKGTLLQTHKGYFTFTPYNICKGSDFSWIKAYKRTSIIDNSIEWPVGLTFEDAEFYFKYFSRNPNTYIIDDCLYNYRERKGSIVTSGREGDVKLEDIFQVVRNIKDYYIEKGLYDRYKPALLELVGSRISLCRKIKNNYEKTVQLAKEILSEFDIKNNYVELKKTSSPIFSIIVPVYNVQNYIAQCIKSIQNQTFYDFEILVVDDCGTDCSMDIVKKFALDDARIKIIKHDRNLGLGAARNTGLDNATGEYVYYLDADDFIEDNTLELLYKEADETETDIVGCEWFLSFNKNERHMVQPKVSSGEELFIKMARGVIRWNLWLFMVKRSLYEDNNIRFIDKMNMGEDMMVMMKLALYSNKVSILNIPLYHYIQTKSDSLTRNWSKGYMDQITANVNEVERHVKGSYGDRFNKEINFLKLNIKLPLLISASTADYEKWMKWFPEANNSIMYNKDISLRTRMIQMFAYKRQYWLLKLYYYLIIRFVYGILYK